MHKAIIRRTKYGRRLVLIDAEEAERMVQEGRAVRVGARLLQEPEASAPTYKIKPMEPEGGKRRRGKSS